MQLKISFHLRGELFYFLCGLIRLIFLSLLTSSYFVITSYSPNWLLETLLVSIHLHVRILESKSLYLVHFLGTVRHKFIFIIWFNVSVWPIALSCEISYQGLYQDRLPESVLWGVVALPQILRECSMFFFSLMGSTSSFYTQGRHTGHFTPGRHFGPSPREGTLAVK